MNESLFEKLVEISWRRRLTAGEERELQAWLRNHPEDAERWEAEAGLNQALERLQPAVPSRHFTRRVLELVEREERAARGAARGPGEGRWAQWTQWWRAVLAPGRRVAWAAALVLLSSGLAYQQYREHARAQVVQGVQSLSALAAATEPGVIEDFEVIEEFSRLRPEANPTDEALFALLAGR